RTRRSNSSRLTLVKTCTSITAVSCCCLKESSGTGPMPIFAFYIRPNT
ncbi:uncharacterized protein METZ01_LOCUS14968, partial [marine metagenome]